MDLDALFDVDGEGGGGKKIMPKAESAKFHIVCST